jgi:hypothetical protein
MVELTFLTRVDCHLCAQRAQTVTEVAAGRDVDVTEIDIDTDEDLAATVRLGRSGRAPQRAPAQFSSSREGSAVQGPEALGA